MKNFLFISVLFLVTITKAQNKVPATDIINKINAGESINLKDATITGVLDVTKLKNMKLKRQNNDEKVYLSVVTSGLTFNNCVFADDFLAHVWDEKSKTSYVTNFEEQVTFLNCTFTKECSFKHSAFRKSSRFEGSVFAAEADFKHAAFSENAVFSSCMFRGYANFKHTSFRGTNFDNAQFDNYADFKHTSFSDFANFHGALFKSNADYKHTAFSNGVSFANASFKEHVDFKHTSCSGKAKMDGTVFEKDVDASHSNILKK